MAAKALIWIVIFGAFVIGLIVYINNRDQESQKFQHITSLDQIVNAPATICTYNPTDFGNGTAGILYIESGRMRFDIKELEYGGYAASVEAVLNADGTRQMDPDTYNRLSGQGTGAVGAINMLLTKAPWKCSPWWFVNESFFTIPGGVSF
ncbi:MAG TPA: hypothetical protein VMU25_03350 [Candidatus Paceibacterota bacterium]|nr:hypothetical protein [Candidatus Paceibacterota bacterium]